MYTNKNFKTKKSSEDRHCRRTGNRVLSDVKDGLIVSVK